MRGSISAAHALIAALLLALSPARARAEAELSVSLVKPGGGYLVTDARQKLAIELIVRDARGPVELARADVKANQGKATSAEVVGPGRVVFLYAPPDKTRTGADMLDLRLVKKSGGDIQYAVPLELAAPESPKLSFELTPSRIDAREASPITVRAQTSGVATIGTEVSAGRLRAGPDGQSTLDLPDDLPQEAPSHVLALAVASSLRGFAVRTQGLSVLAELRVSTPDVEPGHQLVLEGSENKVASVTGAADGRTVIKDLVRYGANVRAFSVKGKQRKEIPISVPSGLVPIALAAAIPGQNVADGGTGPSIVVSIPPPPFGGPLAWPELRVEGATLVGTREIPGVRDAKVLVLQRPRAPRSITVTADGAKIVSIPFGAAHGEALRVEAAPPRTGERAALTIFVTDVFGSPADSPVPRASLESGEELPVERTGSGEYRAAIASGSKGETGSKVHVRAELTPPRSLTEEPLELPRAEVDLELRGAPPAVNVAPAPVVVAEPIPAVSGGRRFGLRPYGHVGFALSGPLFVGAGIEGELRLPPLDERLSIVAALEGFRGSGSGSITLDGTVQQDASAQFGGLAIPVGASFRGLELGGVDLSVRAALELRVEAGAIDVAAERAGGAQSFGIGGRVGLEGALTLGPGQLSVVAGLVGLGASASGFSAKPSPQLEGDLMQFRLDLGYRFWLF